MSIHKFNPHAIWNDAIMQYLEASAPKLGVQGSIVSHFDRPGVLVVRLRRGNNSTEVEIIPTEHLQMFEVVNAISAGIERILPQKPRPGTSWGKNCPVPDRSRLSHKSWKAERWENVVCDFEETLTHLRQSNE